MPNNLQNVTKNTKKHRFSSAQKLPLNCMQCIPLVCEVPWGLNISKKNLMRNSGAWIFSTYCKLYVRDLQTPNFVRNDPQDFQISKFWVRGFIPWPRITEQKCHQIYSTVKFVEQNFHFPILCRNLYGRYP
jgi:hypothetical protein